MINESLAPSFSPTTLFETDTTTNVLANVLGICNNCPEDTSLFNDVQNRHDLKERMTTRLLQSDECLSSQSPEQVFGLFQQNLASVLPGLEVFSFIDLGSTESLGPNFTSIVQQISKPNAILVVDVSTFGESQLSTEKVLTPPPTPTPTPERVLTPPLAPRPTSEISDTPPPIPSPSPHPTPEPTRQPTKEPTDQPTDELEVEPTMESTVFPTTSPIKEPYSCSHNKQQAIH